MTEILNEFDKTIFIEYYPTYRLVSCWGEDGKLIWYEIEESKRPTRLSISRYASLF